MRLLFVVAVLAVFISPFRAVADVTYDEQFAAYFAYDDFPWQPTGEPSRFFNADYAIAHSLTAELKDKRAYS